MIVIKDLARGQQEFINPRIPGHTPMGRMIASWPSAASMSDDLEPRCPTISTGLRAGLPPENRPEDRRVLRPVAKKTFSHRG